mmetsp:Transcript_35583/g.93032  ORF Transcript_35583/g.93032 Transcript_35583/m.93032 type:complete len:295 (-) Transcript_35583:171-1055(-)
MDPRESLLRPLVRRPYRGGSGGGADESWPTAAAYPLEGRGGLLGRGGGRGGRVKLSTGLRHSALSPERRSSRGRGLGGRGGYPDGDAADAAIPDSICSRRSRLAVSCPSGDSHSSARRSARVGGLGGRGGDRDGACDTSDVGTTGGRRGDWCRCTRPAVSRLASASYSSWRTRAISASIEVSTTPGAVPPSAVAAATTAAAVPSSPPPLSTQAEAASLRPRFDPRRFAAGAPPPPSARGAASSPAFDSGRVGCRARVPFRWVDERDIEGGGVSADSLTTTLSKSAHQSSVELSW